MISNNIKLFPGIMPAIALLVAIILIVSGFAIYESHELADLTSKIHNHPLAVSNAVRKIQSNINAMHRSMKDVVIAQTPEEFSSAVERVDVYERKSFEAFDMIADRFLGNLKYVTSARQDFKNWKKIRSSVIALKNKGRQEEAAEITKGKGSLHIDLMNEGTDEKSGLNYLLRFAEKKALDFKEMSEQREQRASLQIVLVFALSIMLFLAATILFQRNRKSTNALRESEERFRTIFEQAGVGAALMDTKTGQFIRINSRFCNMLGYTNEEMISNTFMKITHPDDLEEDQNNMEKIKAGKIRKFSMEKRYYHKDGSIVWVKLFVSPMWAVGQKPNNHIAVIEDISESKQVEKALKKRRDQLEELVKERTAKLTGSNEQLRREIEERKKAENKIRLNESLLEVLLRLSEMREATVREMADFVLEEGVRLTQSTIGFLGFMNDQETVMTLHSWSKAVMEKCRISGKQIQFPIDRVGLWGEVIRQRKPIVTNDYSLPNPHKKGFPAGHVNLLRLLVFPLVIRNRVVALIAVANKVKEYDDLDLRHTKLLMEGLWDITQYQNSKDESQRLREELSHLTRVASIGELTTSLAHELNQPLTAILSNAQAVQRFLKSDAPDMNEVKDALNDIINDNRRASGVIQSLRKFLQQGNIQSLPVDINKIIQETLTLVNTDFVVNYISLTLDLFDDLPPVLGDYIQLQQVILNLILNAVEAMRGVEKGSRELVVRTHCDDPSTITVEIQDSGLGMNSGKIDEIFDPFVTTKHDGLGMGLSISRTIIEAHSGWIRASQNPEGGAIFTFSLPVYKE